MPRLAGFSDNAFETRADFESAAVALLRGLQQHQSKGGARILLPVATGAHFDETAAELEGYARPLWAIAALIAGKNGQVSNDIADLIEPYCRGLANGTDPEHDEYWGAIVVRDQRMVEMEIISFALLAAPDQFFKNQSEKSQKNIISWLLTINGKDLPTTNWLWFRVMTNLALIKVCGLSHDSVKADMDADLDLLDRFYIGHGWSADGLWTDDGRQADYYSGSFAIQFSQLLYVRYANDIDPVRCLTFVKRAQEYSLTFWRYFDANGAAIPFGRSLTYRFAMAGFWATVAAAGITLPTPLDDPGTVKGLLLRHLRWWASRPNMFHPDGTLTIGFTYPNMFMCEDYNSPQSPYWSMKTFCALVLPQDSAFWAAKEQPLPSIKIPIQVVEPPMHIVCSRGRHHFLLSSGQYCPWPLKATEAKYGKFAYSSHFGFSVPTGTLIQQMAPDSTLALSIDGGDTWKVRWIPLGTKFVNMNISLSNGQAEQVAVLKSLWRPWKNYDVEVETFLIPPTSEWPDWHVRVHHFKTNERLLPSIEAVEGGFAIQCRSARHGTWLPRFGDLNELMRNNPASTAEGIVEQNLSALICSNAGSSGIAHLHANRVTIKHAEALKVDSNTNLIWQRTQIPVMRSTVQCAVGATASIVTGVFAVARTLEDPTAYDGYDKVRAWQQMPEASVFHGIGDIA